MNKIENFDKMPLLSSYSGGGNTLGLMGECTLMIDRGNGIFEFIRYIRKDENSIFIDESHDFRKTIKGEKK